MAGHRAPLPINSLATAKVVVVGEAPGAAGRADLPLYPLPPGCAGHRLFKMTALPNMRTYLTLLFRANLLSYNPGPNWPKREAHIAAMAMLPFLRERQVVLLGRKVARAFGVGQYSFMEWNNYRDLCDVAVLPHPSGRNLWYQDGGNLYLAGQFWTALLD